MKEMKKDLKNYDFVHEGNIFFVLSFLNEQGNQISKFFFFLEFNYCEGGKSNHRPPLEWSLVL